MRLVRSKRLTALGSAFLCAPCMRKLSLAASCSLRQAATHSPHSANQQNILKKKYFLANDVWDKSSGPNARWLWSPTDRPRVAGIVATAGDSTKPASPEVLRQDVAHSIKDTSLPHRRRRRKQAAEGSEEYAIPLDASSQLSTMSSAAPMNSFKQRFFTYLSLSKPRLTFLIVLTTTAAYSIFPVAVSPLSTSMDLSPFTLLNLTAGTALSSASANALNMLFEPTYDAKMSRTRNRPLVRGLITPRNALLFATLTGAAGVGLLAYGVNPTVAFLGGLNIFLYAGVYTPMKRISVANTWVGAIVGGIPPLMGWAAAAGQSTTAPDAGWRELLFDPRVSTGGWLLAALLFAWQFPHFNALSYTIRHEYAAAGYRMLASVNPRKNALIGLRYSVLMFPICVGLSYVGVTGWTFIATSGVVNGWMLREAWRFYRAEGARGTARGLFWASVWHLPLVLVLAMVHKRGLWERFVRGGLDDEEFEEYAADYEEIETHRRDGGQELPGPTR